MNFAYVSFVTNNQTYIDLMKTTIDSVKHFSKYKLIIYCVNIPEKVFDDCDQIIIRNINIILPNVYYYKPYVIIDSIKQGLKSGYYIESDDVLTPFADDYLYKETLLINTIPISPIHPDDVQIPIIDMVTVNSLTKTQHYIHAHVLFTDNCLSFIEEWMNYCLKYNNYKNADETVLNLMYWKYNCKNHYLEIIDPWYENFYSNILQYSSPICTYHGCKDPLIQRKLFNELLFLFKKI